MPLLDDALKNFPKSLIWLLQSSGWKAPQGPHQAKAEFYKGMNAGFEFIKENEDSEITAQVIEDLYTSFLQFDEEYQSNDLFQKYSEAFGSHEMILDLPGLEAQATVSEAGLREFIDVAKKAYAQKGIRTYPQYGIYIETQAQPRPIHFDPNQVSDSQNQLREHLIHASRSKMQCSLEPKTSKEQLTRVELASYSATRAEVLQWIEADIHEYLIQLEKAKNNPDPTERPQAQIRAINDFIRKLLQAQYFPTGKLATCTILLANMLLLQNGLGLKMTQTPMHYIAFSSDELLQETLQDIKRFNEYKITQAKEVLEGTTADEVHNSKAKLGAELMKTLNSDPLIAMAQLNELFEQIESNTLVCPQDYAPDPRFFSILGKKISPHIKEAHFEVLNLLKEAYLNQLKKLVDAMPEMDKEKRLGYNATETGLSILKTIMESHKISKKCDEDKINDLLERFDKNETELYSKENELKPSV